MTSNSHFTADEARVIGTEIGIDWGDSPFDVDEFRDGLDVELALAHLKEFPDYYTRLKKMETEAEAAWAQDD